MNNDKNNEEDKLVMLTSIRSIHLAISIEKLLSDYGIKCFVRNRYSNMIMGELIDIGGFRIDVKSSDVETALKIIAQYGIELPNESDGQIGKLTSFVENISILRKIPLENRLWIIIVLLSLIFIIIALLGAIIFQ